MAKKKSIFKSNILTIPNLARAYCFQLKFYNNKTKQYEDELLLRAKKFTNESVITFDEFEDFYVTKYFDNLTDDTTFNITVVFYDLHLYKKIYSRTYKNQKLQWLSFGDLNQEGNDKVTV